MAVVQAIVSLLFSCLIFGYRASLEICFVNFPCLRPRAATVLKFDQVAKKPSPSKSVVTIE